MEWTDRFSEVERLRIIQAAKKSLRNEEGKKALKYLKEQRGFSDAIIDSFDFGYCPLGVNHQLQGRIITPIYDLYGEALAVSTRHLDENWKNRFWHERFDKGSALFGLRDARKNILRYRKVLVVEGEFDVACLHSFGFTITVGVCGSAFTLSHASLLARYCTEVYIMFDSDVAGRDGVERIQKLYKKHHFEKFGINYIPVSLPLGVDPDDFVKKYGAIGLQKLLKTAKEEYQLWN